MIRSRARSMYGVGALTVVSPAAPTGARQRARTSALVRAVALWIVAAVALTAPLAFFGCASPTPGETSPTANGRSGTAASAGSTIPLGEAVPPWILLRGGAKQDQGWAVAVDSSGDVYFGTHQQAESAPFTDMVVYRLRPDGTEIWKARWGGRFADKAFAVAPAGSVVYVGGLTYRSVSLTDADMVVLALDARDGSLLWEYTWGQGYGYEEVDGLAVDGDYLYVSGWTTGKASSNDLALLKLDLSGGLVWAKTWGAEGWDEADGRLVVRDEGVYVAGRFGGANILLGGKGVVARFSKETGDLLDHVTWGGPLFTDALGMTGTADHLYVVGLTLDKGDGGQIFLRKMTPDLTLVWERVWGGRKSESARAVMVDEAGDILVAGETDSQGQGALDFALLRYSPAGQLLWEGTWGGPAHDGSLGIAGRGGDTYVAGKTASFGLGADEAVLLHVVRGGEGFDLPQPGRGSTVGD